MDKYALGTTSPVNAAPTPAESPTASIASKIAWLESIAQRIEAKVDALVGVEGQPAGNTKQPSSAGFVGFVNEHLCDVAGQLEYQAVRLERLIN